MLYSSLFQLPEITCYDVYTVLIHNSITEMLYGPVIPVLLDASQQTLDLGRFSGLPPNKNLTIQLSSSSNQTVAQSTFSKFGVLTMRL